MTASDWDALILKQTPGIRGAIGDSFAPGTGDFAKFLRERNFRVAFENGDFDGREAILKSNEFWFPVVMFLEAVVSSGLGELLADYAKIRLGNRFGRSNLHLKVCIRGNGDKWFEASGKGDEVFPALEEFLNATDED